MAHARKTSVSAAAIQASRAAIVRNSPVPRIVTLRMASAMAKRGSASAHPAATRAPRAAAISAPSAAAVASSVRAPTTAGATGYVMQRQAYADATHRGAAPHAPSWCARWVLTAASALATENATAPRASATVTSRMASASTAGPASCGRAPRPLPTPHARATVHATQRLASACATRLSAASTLSDPEARARPSASGQDGAARRATKQSSPAATVVDPKTTLSAQLESRSATKIPAPVCAILTASLATRAAHAAGTTRPTTGLPARPR